jgi:hypothetical protein
MGTLKGISNAEMRRQFLAWQCRIRQISARDHGGRPVPGMRPRVLSRSGAVIVDAMTILLVPQNTSDSLAFFKFQVQRTNEPRNAYESGLRYLAEGFYQDPDRFADTMTALFASSSPVARRMLRERECLLSFEQSAQRYTMFCAVRRLAARHPAREVTLWHNRMFNPTLAFDSLVLAFQPDWKSANAVPEPHG